MDINAYGWSMSEDSPFENDFLFPRIQKHETLQEEIHALDRFRMKMSEEDQSAFDNLIQRSMAHASISYLSPRQSPFEHLLLTMMIELRKETVILKDEVKWKLGGIDR